jgi:hypothetical protein
VNNLHAINRDGITAAERKYAGHYVSPDNLSSVFDISRPEKEVALSAVALMAHDGKRNSYSLGSEEDMRANRKQAGMILNLLSGDTAAEQTPQVMPYVPRHGRTNDVVGRSYWRPSVRVGHRSSPTTKVR